MAEAHRWNPQNFVESGMLVNWLQGYGVEVRVPEFLGPTVRLAFTDGGVNNFIADPGDWIIHTVRGEWLIARERGPTLGAHFELEEYT